ncbi:glucosamine-6-phosphate deaminase [Rubripirellula amarantea]|uniref:Glucosamine-6-phosphate deaminase n=1 Tax=Rubripirellula amarantea TaxID=2527999 RepID=A0A5C5WK18_9BACT|nr:glucosamine-6-phosphate deaminase [Rubripirellula amarantea]MDA8744637.1 glucosamine-6-phosphate deaminase [Rubripirellula amarantea]TWT51126.1 Glucosamine-6-phosphate deaminase 1 [Rubripirellula amarantea]
MSFQDSNVTERDGDQPGSIAFRIFADSKSASSAVATEIASLIRTRASQGKTCVLGLVAGSSPIDVYVELVRMHREEGLSFANVTTFNLDEYLPMEPDGPQSYVRFMNENLFSHIDMRPENIHIPDGTLATEQVADFCRRYEGMIAEAGGIDIQVLGINRTGHIGFNEPGSDLRSRTRMITLDNVTRTDAASDFFGIENVPRRAITMGVGTIMEARRILLLAFGDNKASIVARTIEGGVDPSVPATFLQLHDQAEFIIDSGAASALSHVIAPWSCGDVVWDRAMVRRAVIGLSQEVGKPILMLTDAHYNQHGLQGLLAEYGSAYEINLQVFRQLQATITGWPAGKPEHAKQAGDRPSVGDDVFPKRILAFSPHPDDDVVSMGGTLIRLAGQGHDVHVAYQTSGNIAVFDDDALRFADFITQYCEEFSISSPRIDELDSAITQSLRNKDPNQVDSDEVRRIKGLIRRGEAIAGARVCGIPEEKLHFMNLPFYETGRVQKGHVTEKDVQLTVDLMREIQPHQIYAAGDLSDPHGTHRTCLDIIFKACRECQNDDWMKSCDVWLYRGAWQEWGPHEIEMAVPLSPQEVDKKRVAIFKHESQKDRAMFPGSDMREFWQRAEARNADTARVYDALGMAQYQAMEGFVRWKRD